MNILTFLCSRVGVNINCVMLDNTGLNLIFPHQFKLACMPVKCQNSVGRAPNQAWTLARCNAEVAQNYRKKNRKSTN